MDNEATPTMELGAGSSPLVHESEGARVDGRRGTAAVTGLAVAPRRLHPFGFPLKGIVAAVHPVRGEGNARSVLRLCSHPGDGGRSEREGMRRDEKAGEGVRIIGVRTCSHPGDARRGISSVGWGQRAVTPARGKVYGPLSK